MWSSSSSSCQSNLTTHHTMGIRVLVGCRRRRHHLLACLLQPPKSDVHSISQFLQPTMTEPTCTPPMVASHDNDDDNNSSSSSSSGGGGSGGGSSSSSSSTSITTNSAASTIKPPPPPPPALTTLASSLPLQPIREAPVRMSAAGVEEEEEEEEEDSTSGHNNSVVFSSLDRAGSMVAPPPNPFASDPAPSLFPPAPSTTKAPAEGPARQVSFYADPNIFTHRCAVPSPPSPHGSTSQARALHTTLIQDQHGPHGGRRGWAPLHRLWEPARQGPVPLGDDRNRDRDRDSRAPAAVICLGAEPRRRGRGPGGLEAVLALLQGPSVAQLCIPFKHVHL